MAPAVFIVQGAVSKDWKGAIMFAIAIAVGITPEMLPMIVVSSIRSFPSSHRVFTYNRKDLQLGIVSCSHRQAESHRKTLRRHPKPGCSQCSVL